MYAEYAASRRSRRSVCRRHGAAAEPRHRRRRAGDVRGRAGHDARHRPRHVSRSSPRRARPPAAHRPAPACRRPRSRRSSASPRRTARASAKGRSPPRLHDAVGEAIRKKGNEFGAVTGRPRRCGWLDLPLLRYSNMINGTSWLVVTKLDVLDELRRDSRCVELQDRRPSRRRRFRRRPRASEKIEPIYTHCRDGRRSTFGIDSTSGCRRKRRTISHSWRRNPAPRSASSPPGRTATRRRLIPEFTQVLDR